MTPKEKAIELVDKMSIDWDMYKGQNIKCALIAVDEIMYSYPTDPYKTLQPININPLEYWRQVKQEIQSL